MKYFPKKIIQPPSAGLRSAMNSLLLEIAIYLMHRRGLKQARKFHRSSHLRLHLGCGPRIKDGWVNIDLNKDADVSLDLRKPLPFPDDSCSIIYSEHFLEHIDYPRPVIRFLNECYRVLEPGGIFSVAVPDIELVLRSYVEGGTEEYYAAQKKWHPSWCKTQMEHINYNFRQDNEHRFCYDYKTLSNLLDRSGFVEIHRRSFNPEIDDEQREVGSLYVGCIKPQKAFSQI